MSVSDVPSFGSEPKLPSKICEAHHLVGESASTRMSAVSPFADCLYFVGSSDRILAAT
jgi:hypothetical protein